MDEETKIICETEFDASEIIQYGEKIAESYHKDVYRRGDEILKVLKEGKQTDQMKRLGTYLPENLAPSTLARTKDLSDTEVYSGAHTVIYQNRFNERLDEKLDSSQEYGELGDLIYLLDRIVEEDAVMSDPVMENFNYFGTGQEKTLKPSDICDIESLKKFPHSFEAPKIKTSFYEEIENMYEEAMLSVNHETDLTMAETATIFEETSKHVRNVDLEPRLSLDEWPEVEVFLQ